MVVFMERRGYLKTINFKDDDEGMGPYLQR